jgi:SAM-dependent methyltransferase
VSDVWSERAELYRDSDAHREGADLDLLVQWAEGETALDVATGGGHVARRLRNAGFTVVTADPSPGMEPDVICRAEDLPFVDSSFDVVACRIAAHHFDDVAAAMREMARLARRLVLVVDNVYRGEAAEEAERLRDPTHIRNHTEEEWRNLFEQAGLRLEAVEVVEATLDLEAWLARAGCNGSEAERVRALLGDWIHAGTLTNQRIALKGWK